MRDLRTTPVGAAGLRVDRVLPVVLFALVLVVAVLTVTSWPVGVFEDDAVYTVLWYSVKSYRRGWWVAQQRDSGAEAKPFLEWTARYTARNDVLATEHDLMVYLYTGRQAVPVSTFVAKHRLGALSEEETLFWVEQIIDQYKPRFYVTGWNPAIRAADTLAARRPPLLRRVGNTSNAVVYERIDR